MKKVREDLLKRQRSYAGYFHFRRDKIGTEVGVVEDWLRARYDNPDAHFYRLDPRPNPLDPPDVVLTDHKGLRFGIEVTELVDGPTISAWEKNCRASFKVYEKEEFYTLLCDRISEKSRTEFNEPPYERRILIIYSDEPELCRDDFFGRSHDKPIFDAGAFSEVWFMMPPKPNSSAGVTGNSVCRSHQIAKKG